MLSELFENLLSCQKSVQSMMMTPQEAHNDKPYCQYSDFQCLNGSRFLDMEIDNQF